MISICTKTLIFTLTSVKWYGKEIDYKWWSQSTVNFENHRSELSYLCGWKRTTLTLLLTNAPGFKFLFGQHIQLMKAWCSLSFCFISVFFAWLVKARPTMKLSKPPFSSQISASSSDLRSPGKSSSSVGLITIYVVSKELSPRHSRAFRQHWNSLGGRLTRCTVLALPSRKTTVTDIFSDLFDVVLFLLLMIMMILIITFCVCQSGI